MKHLAHLVLFINLISPVMSGCGANKSSDDYSDRSSGTPAPAEVKEAETKPLPPVKETLPAEKPADVTPPPPASSDTTAKAVTYKTAIAALVLTTCIRCHGAGSSRGDFSTFANVKAKAIAMNTRIKNGSMPLGGALNSDQKALFQAWVDGGMLE